MKIRQGILWGVVLLLLSGCMYPYAHKQHSAPPYPEQLNMVQESIDRYHQETGLLPIYNFDQDTPLYHRYAIDFNQLIPRYLSEPPSSSFERGGPYRYVLINVETKPEVKVIDLRLSQAVADFQLRINSYLQNHPYLPVDQMLEGGYFTLKYKELGLKGTPTVESPYSGQYLPLIVNQRGQAGIDYRIDLYQVLQKKGEAAIKEGDDIRFLLTEESPFVPAHSFPYTLKDGEPVLIPSWERKN
jgi:hypothetical protein